MQKDLDVVVEMILAFGRAFVAGIHRLQYASYSTETQQNVTKAQKTNQKRKIKPQPFLYLDVLTILIYLSSSAGLGIDTQKSKEIIDI